ncbi:MAG: phage major tail protein, TP901-1 family [Bacillaceae bacterium]|nr:phage major tail protein, TP901-1 family [Bacillaceae bacterium]
MKGVDVLVKNGNDVLAGQRNATLNRSAEALDATSKDSEGWKENEQGLKEWSVATDGLLVDGDTAFQALEEAYMNGTAVDVSVALPSGNEYSGKAIITDFPINAPYTDKVTYNVTFQGTGKLEKLPVV